MIQQVKRLIRKLGWFNKLIFVANLFFALLLLISYLSPFIPPSKLIYLTYFGLLYPVFLIVNLLFVFYWIFQKNFLALISFFLIVLGIMNLGRFFQVGGIPEKYDSEEGLNVMSFNVRVFDLYNWQANNESKTKIIEFIQKESPDVICFQEYYRGENVHFDIRKSLEVNGDYKFIEEHINVVKNEKKGNGKNYFGSAIFSKFPIINEKYFEFPNDKNNHFSFVDILKGIDTIRVFNAHLGSMRLQNADYKLIGGDDNKKWKGEYQQEQNIIERMSFAFVKRELQTKQLIGELKQSPYPIILCVDLNDTPNSYAYHQIAKNYSDNFIKKGSGVGSTYIGDNAFNRLMPINRIDYIFTSSDFKIGMLTTHNVSLSDHNPISSSIKLRKD